jgi:hypothetical protein
VINYSQKDHFIYFKADKEFTPDIEKNLEFEPHVRTNQSQTYVMANIGACISKEISKDDFDFSGFASHTLAPLGFLDYSSNPSEDSHDNVEKSDYYNKGSTLAFGGELVVRGMAKYKDKYYFKVKVEPNYLAGLTRDKASSANRITHYELGYIVNSSLSINLNIENNELLFHNKDRHAIDVFNTFGLGLVYKTPYRKSIKVN